jgi:hypothetical protein
MGTSDPWHLHQRMRVLSDQAARCVCAAPSRHNRASKQQTRTQGRCCCSCSAHRRPPSQAALARPPKTAMWQRLQERCQMLAVTTQAAFPWRRQHWTAAPPGSCCRPHLRLTAVSQHHWQQQRQQQQHRARRLQAHLCQAWLQPEWQQQQQQQCAWVTASASQRQWWRTPACQRRRQVATWQAKTQRTMACMRPCL